MNEPDFRDIQTYSELLNLYRHWLQGKIKTSPTYAGPPNEETLPYIPQLLRMNEQGLLTVNSQPGIVEKVQLVVLWNREDILLLMHIQNLLTLYQNSFLLEGLQ